MIRSNEGGETAGEGGFPFALIPQEHEGRCSIHTVRMGGADNGRRGEVQEL
jgi:hypothetical protein